MDLCALSVLYGLTLKFPCQDFPELRILEQLGFVVSTENNSNIAIRINGHCHTIEGHDYFCLRRGKHDESQNL